MRPFFKSSQSYRQIQRYSGMLQLAGRDISQLTSSSMLDYSTKTALIFLNMAAFAKRDIKPLEKKLLLLQLSFLITQWLMMSMAYFGSWTSNQQNIFYKSVLFINYVYTGFLLTGLCSIELEQQDLANYRWNSNRFFHRLGFRHVVDDATQTEKSEVTDAACQSDLENQIVVSSHEASTTETQIRLKKDEQETHVQSSAFDHIQRLFCYPA